MPEPLESWTPSFGNFLVRFLLVGVLTALFLAVLPLGLRETDPRTYWLGLLSVLLISPMVWGFVFDDHMKWLRHRRERWLLLPDRLQLQDGTGGSTDLMLREISAADVTLLRDVRITRRDGPRIIARYLSRPGEIVRLVNAAIAADAATR